MGNIVNAITIETDSKTVWDILADLELLEQYDPTVKKSVIISSQKSGVGAKRKVTMADGKNWFDEQITVSKPSIALTYQLTDCSFPIQGLQHSYTFETLGKTTRVNQVMEYSVKFGFLGKILDSLIMKRQFDKGIKLFLAGLKSHIETK